MGRLGRFIPAGAGNSHASKVSAGSVAVHPRWRGEQAKAMVFMHSNDGSSPLARGTAAAGQHAQVLARFIPAGAGNSQSGSGRPGTTPVHPRWRGEQWAMPAPISSASGSSPLARGTASPRADGGHRHRFIPAGAGNRARMSGASGVYSVHPRWRGEQGARSPRRPTGRGSSPLARGTGCR